MKHDLEAEIRARDARIAELERLVRTKPNTAKRRIYEAAIEEARIHGFELRMGDVVKRSGVSQGAVYNTHYTGGKEQVITEMCQEMQKDFLAGVSEIIQIEDGRKAMMSLMRFHAEHTSKWGMISAHILSGFTPPEYLGWTDVPGLKKVFGHLVKRCKEQGYCRKDVSTRQIVHVWSSLLAAERITASLNDGLTHEEICEITMDFMIRSFYVHSSCLIVRSVDAVSGANMTRYEGVIDDDYYLEFHRQLFANPNFSMTHGITDLRYAKEVKISPMAVNQMCEWARAMPEKFPPPARLAVVAGEGAALQVAENYYTLMNQGPVKVEVFKTIEDARAWLFSEEDT